MANATQAPSTETKTAGIMDIPYKYGLTALSPSRTFMHLVFSAYITMRRIVFRR